MSKELKLTQIIKSRDEIVNSQQTVYQANELKSNNSTNKELQAESTDNLNPTCKQVK